MNSKAVRVVSGATITLLIFGHFLSLFVYTVGDTFVWVKDFGCKTERTHTLRNYAIFTWVFNQLIVLTLFGLFLRPLIIKLISQDENGAESNRKEIKRAIRISTFSLLACVLSDILVPVVARTLTYNRPNFYFAFFFDQSLLINIVALVFTYEKYPDILFGVCRGSDVSD